MTSCYLPMCEDGARFWWAEVCNCTDVTERQFGILITIRRLHTSHLAPFPHLESHFPLYYIAFVIIICLFILSFLHILKARMLWIREREAERALVFSRDKETFVPPRDGCATAITQLHLLRDGPQKQYRINHRNLTKPIISGRAIHRIIASASIALFSSPLPFEPKIWH